jgi:hypothetical protein
MGDTDSLSENGVQCNISGKLDNSSMYLFYSRLLPWLARPVASEPTRVRSPVGAFY